MTTHCYSPFWLDYACGRVRLSAIWADRELALRGWEDDDRPSRDAPVEQIVPVPAKEMRAWLLLSDKEQSDQVFAYAGSRPPRNIHWQQDPSGRRAVRRPRARTNEEEVRHG